MEYSCFITLCQFLLYCKVNQLHIYIYPFFFGFPSNLGNHRDSVEFPVLCSRFSLVIYIMHSIRGVYVQSWSPSSSHAPFPPDICMFSTPMSLLRTETEKVAIADCVPLQSGRWCALSLLVEILETIFGVKSKAWKSSPSIYRLCVWSNFFSEMEAVICTNYKQSAGFGDGVGGAGGNRLLILTPWFSSFENLDALPKFPKLHFPYLQNSNNWVVARVRKTRHTALSLVAGI